MEPDVVAIRAILRALETLDAPSRTRVLEYVAARELKLPGFSLDAGRKNARLLETLRWVRKECGKSYQTTDALPLIDRALKEANVEKQVLAEASR